MKLIIRLLMCLVVTTTAQASCPDNASVSDRADRLVDCITSLRKESEKHRSAIAAYRVIGADPVSILDYVSVEELRVTPDIAKFAESAHYELWTLFTPEGYREKPTDSFQFLRSRFSTAESLRWWYGTAKDTAIRLINRAAVAGALVNAGDRLEPILTRPADALLAQKGLQWLYSLHCTKEDFRNGEPCKTSAFPAEFRAIYNTEPTHENVWILGFLVRRDLERRGLSVAYQEIARDLLTTLGWKPRN